MPSRPCKHPTCVAYVQPPAKYCADHATAETPKPESRHTFYDQHKRDRTAKEFYNSRRWQDARSAKLASHPTCEWPAGCIEWATTVHHRKALRECTDAEKTDQPNLMSLCAAHHNEIEAGIARAEG